MPPTEPPPTAPPTEPPPTAPPQGRTVTASNPAETVMTTVDKPPLVLIALLVDTESCGTESPQGSFNLCLEIDATGATEMLEDDPALITIHLTASRWSALRSGYRNGQFWVFKRSDAAAAWADIPACINGATDECYEVTQYRDGSAKVTIRNVRSFSQYAIAVVPPPRSAGSGGGADSRRRGSLARVTGTPTPTVPVIVPPTVRPTAVIPTLPPPTVPPTAVPPTAVPPTAVPPTPGSTPHGDTAYGRTTHTSTAHADTPDGSAAHRGSANAYRGSHASGSGRGRHAAAPDTRRRANAGAHRGYRRLAAHSSGAGPHSDTASGG